MYLAYTTCKGCVSPGIGPDIVQDLLASGVLPVNVFGVWVARKLIVVLWGLQ